MKAHFLIGRLLFGGFFVYGGIKHFKNRQMLSQYVKSKNIPAPDLAVIATGAALILGGTSILLGVKPKLGAAALVGFLAGASPIMHDFWRVEDPNQRMNDMINFLKNLALLGGAMALMGVDEPWPASIPLAKRGTLERVRQFARKRIAA